MAFGNDGFNMGATTGDGGGGMTDNQIKFIQTLIAAGGAGLQSYGASKSAGADREQNAQQFAANMAQRQAENNMTDVRSRQIAAEGASPLGGDQQYAQRNAILQALLSNARNYSFTPGDPRVAAAMGNGNNPGGMRLPEGGLDPAMLQRLYGDASTQGAIAQHAKAVGQINPNAPPPDFHNLYGMGEQGTENPFMTDVRTSNDNARVAQEAERARSESVINRAIDEDVNGTKQKKKGGILKKIAKYALMAAPIVAAPFTGGASLALIGAASGAAAGAMDGGGIKGALTGGALGAIPLGGGGLAKGAVKPTLAAGLKQGVKKAAPSIISNAILNR
jgi:hypothetical protein